jgi:hypothetical protein
MSLGFEAIVPPSFWCFAARRPSGLTASDFLREKPKI